MLVHQRVNQEVVRQVLPLSAPYNSLTWEVCVKSFPGLAMVPTPHGQICKHPGQKWRRSDNKAPRRDPIWLCGYAPKAWYLDGTPPNRWLLDGYSLKYGDSDNSFLTYPHIWGPKNSSRSILLKMVIGFSNSSLGPPICIPPIHKFPSGFAMGMFKQQKRTTHYPLVN